MKITIAGVGYVGLSLAVLLAQNHEVTAITTTPSKARQLNQFISPIKDAEIERFFREAKAGERELRFAATVDKAAAYADAELVIIATPTDYDEVNHFFDTTAVEDAIACVQAYNPDVPVVIKSTIPVGYTESVREKFVMKNIIFSPEFLRESHAMYDNLHPSRIVVGCGEGEEEQARLFAELLVEGVETERERAGEPVREIPRRILPLTEAEAVKLFANTYLAMRVSYFNELDSFALAKGLDSRRIIDSVCLDSRIGGDYNNPSFGYGGYCLPKDTKQLLANYRDVPQDIIGAVVRSNATRKDFIADSILARRPKQVGIFRLTMKSDSDNFRASASMDILRRLRDEGIPVMIYEPMLEDGSVFWDVPVVNDLEKFKAQCDIILANRLEASLSDAAEKVFTRDIYGRD